MNCFKLVEARLSFQFRCRGCEETFWLLGPFVAHVIERQAMVYNCCIRCNQHRPGGANMAQSVVSFSKFLEGKTVENYWRFTTSRERLATVEVFKRSQYRFMERCKFELKRWYASTKDCPRRQQTYERMIYAFDSLTAWRLYCLQHCDLGVPYYLFGNRVAKENLKFIQILKTQLVIK